MPAALNKHIFNTVNTSQSFTAQNITLLYSIYAFPNMVIPLFVGMSVRLRSIKFGILLCVLVFIGHSIFSIGVYLGKYNLMLFGRLLFGIGGESFSIIQNKIVAYHFRGKELSFSMSLTACMSRLGTVTNYLVTPYLATLYGGNICCWIGCGLTFLAVIICTYMVRHKCDDGRVDNADLRIIKDRLGYSRNLNGSVNETNGTGHKNKRDLKKNDEADEEDINETTASRSLYEQYLRGNYITYSATHKGNGTEVTLFDEYGNMACIFERCMKPSPGIDRTAVLKNNEKRVCRSFSREVHPPKASRRLNNSISGYSSLNMADQDTAVDVNGYPDRFMDKLGIDYVDCPIPNQGQIYTNDESFKDTGNVEESLKHQMCAAESRFNQRNISEEKPFKVGALFNEHHATDKAPVELSDDMKARFLDLEHPTLMNDPEIIFYRPVLQRCRNAYHYSFSLLVAISFMFAVISAPFSNIAILLLEKRYGVSIIDAGRLMAIMEGLSLFLILIIGLIADILGGKLVFVTIGGLLLSAAHIIVFLKILSPFVPIILLGVASPCISCYWPCITYLVSADSIGTGFAIFTCVLNVAYTFSPIIVSTLIRHDSSYDNVEFLAICVSFIAFICIFILSLLNYKLKIGLNDRSFGDKKTQVSKDKGSI